MKDIQDIMKEMNNLNNEIEVALDEDEVANAVQDPPCSDNCFGTGGENETNCSQLPNQTRNVPFTCKICAPNGFRFPNGFITSAPIAFDVSCLHCFIEPCNCPSAATGRSFAVRIVGCIKFIINAPTTPQSGQCRPNGTVFLCCSDSVCVDNTICFGCNRVAALIECGLIEATITANPCNVGLRDFRITFSEDHTEANIVGTFILPGCVPLRGSAAAAIAAE